jgi:DNA-binding CsgD family transcriptional regulator
VLKLEDAALVTRAERELAVRRTDAPDTLDAVLAGLAEHWGAKIALYRPCATREGWGIEFLLHIGLRPDIATAFGNYLQTAPRQWSAFDPVRPAPEQRNRVVGNGDLIGDRDPEDIHVVRHFYKPGGLWGLQPMRMLVCDGPMLLAYASAWRQQPFRPSQRATLQALGPALRRRLRLERNVRFAPTLDALVKTLDLIEAPAFLLARRHVECANEAGRQLLQLRGRSLLRSLFDSVERPQEPYEVTALKAIGVPDAHLVIVRGDAMTIIRAARMARAFGLTPRQKDVLTLLAHGDEITDIATKLACIESTIEHHVTAILGKVGVESRSRLLAMFWSA